MEQRIAAVRREAEHAHREARLAVGRDLRRLAGLRADPTGPVDTASVARASPTPYCRLLGLLEPQAAAAQTPAPPDAPLITPGAGLGEEQRIRAAAQRAAMFEVEIHKKIAIAAACLVFALVGIPIALRFPRGGTGLVLATSVAVFAIYYVGLIGGEELGDRLVVSPFLAMWTPNLAFTALGLAGLWFVNRTGMSPRGMSWHDTWRALRRRRPRR
jgi:lipopolysaccharide export system permease protein